MRLVASVHVCMHVRVDTHMPMRTCMCACHELSCVCEYACMHAISVVINLFFALTVICLNTFFNYMPYAELSCIQLTYYTDGTFQSKFPFTGQ